MSVSLHLSPSLSLCVCPFGAREGEELSRVEEGMLKPKAGLCQFSIKRAVNGLYLGTSVRLCARVGGLAPRCRSEPEHRLPAASSGVCTPVGQKAFVSSRSCSSPGEAAAPPAVPGCCTEDEQEIGDEAGAGYPIGDALSAAGSKMGLWGAREGLRVSLGGAAAGGRAWL